MVVPKNLDWVVAAGKGSTSLFIGEHEGDVANLLGQPQSVITKHKGHYYYLYPKLGLQVDFNPQTHLVKALFFHRNGANGYSQSPAETIEGLAPGMTKQAVHDVLGTPEECSAGVGTVGGWSWYSQGIQFNFDEHGIADLMIIFDTGMSLEEQLL